MEKQLIKIIKTKTYFQLSVDEKNALSEWINSEEEFDSLKYLFEGLDTIQDSSEPKEDVKKSLDDLFHEVYPQPSFMSGILIFLFPPEKAIWYRPGIQFGSVLTLAFFVFFAMKPSQEFDQEAKQPLSASVIKKESKKESNKEPEATDEIDKSSTNSNIRSIKHSIEHSYKLDDLSMAESTSSVIVQGETSEDMSAKIVLSSRIIPSIESNESLLEYLSATY